MLIIYTFRDANQREVNSEWELRISFLKKDGRQAVHIEGTREGFTKLERAIREMSLSKSEKSWSDDIFGWISIAPDGTVFHLGIQTIEDWKKFCAQKGDVSTSKNENIWGRAKSRNETSKREFD